MSEQENLQVPEIDLSVLTDLIGGITIREERQIMTKTGLSPIKVLENMMEDIEARLVLTWVHANREAKLNGAAPVSWEEAEDLPFPIYSALMSELKL